MLSIFKKLFTNAFLRNYVKVVNFNINIETHDINFYMKKKMLRTRIFCYNIFFSKFLATTTAKKFTIDNTISKLRA